MAELPKIGPPPDMEPTATSLAKTRGDMEAGRLDALRAQGGPIGARDRVAGWQQELDKLRGLLAQQLDYCRTLREREDLANIMADDPALEERHMLRDWVRSTKTDIRFLHEFLCSIVLRPRFEGARHERVAAAVRMASRRPGPRDPAGVARARDEAAAELLLIGMQAPMTDAQKATKALEDRLRSLVFHDDDLFTFMHITDGAPGSVGPRGGGAGATRQSVVAAAATRRRQRHGAFRRQVLLATSAGASAAVRPVPPAGRRDAGAIVPRAPGRGGAAGGRGAAGAGGGATDPGMADAEDGTSAIHFTSVLELMKIQGGVIGQLSGFALQSRHELAQMLGLDTSDLGRQLPWESATGVQDDAGADAKEDTDAPSHRERLAALRKQASSEVVGVATLVFEFMELLGLVQRARLLEQGEGATMSRVVQRLEDQVRTLERQLVQSQHECRNLETRHAALRDQRDQAGVSGSSISMDDQLTQATKATSELRKMNELNEQLRQENAELAEKAKTAEEERLNLSRMLDHRREEGRPSIQAMQETAKYTQTALRDVRLSLDLLGGMYRRTCDDMAALLQDLDETRDERTTLAKKLHAEIKRARILEQEVARMQSVNTRLMAAHHSVRSSYRELRDSSSATAAPLLAQAQTQLQTIQDELAAKTEACRAAEATAEELRAELRRVREGSRLAVVLAGGEEATDAAWATGPGGESVTQDADEPAAMHPRGPEDEALAGVTDGALVRTPAEDGADTLAAVVAARNELYRRLRRERRRRAEVEEVAARLGDRVRAAGLSLAEVVAAGDAEGDAGGAAPPDE